MSSVKLPEPYCSLGGAPLIRAAIRALKARRVDEANRLLHEHFCARPRRPRFYIEERGIPQIAAEVRRRFPEHVKATLLDANEAARHRFTGPGTFGKYVDLGADFDWSLERSPIPDQEFVAKLNRMFYIISTARAYWYSGRQERYARSAARLIWTYIKRNPPPVPYEGRNIWRPDCWGLLQTALRLRSWVWAHQLLRRTRAWEPLFFSRLLAAIGAHADVLAWHLNRAESNHSTMEMRSLLEAAVTFPEFRRAAAWRRVALGHLDAGLRAQVHADGGQHEASPGYHCGCVSWFAEPYILARRNGLRMPASYPRTVELMPEFAAAVRRPDGTLPPVGDTSIYPPNDALAVGALAFGQVPARTSGKELARAVGPETLWIFGADAPRRLARMKDSGDRRLSRAFPKTGVYVMASGDDSPPAAWSFLQCREKSWGGHAHADSLSFEFAAFGRTVLADSGIFTYHDCPDRVRSKETAAHNTVALDGGSQARAASSWNWEGRTRSKALTWRSNGTLDFFCGEERSWKRLPGKPVHRRALVLRKGARPYLLVVDWVRGSGRHRAQASFHFDSTRVRNLSSGAVSADPKKPNAAVLSLDGAAARLFPDALSHHYDENHPTRTLTLSRMARAPFALIALVLPLAAGGKLKASGRVAAASETSVTVELLLGRAREVVTVTPRGAAIREA